LPSAAAARYIPRRRNTPEDPMPLFEYVCRACQNQFEALVFASDAPTCPKCASADLEKQLSAFAVGSGGGDPAPAASPCGRCGDPRGPGACAN
jgi:putative FmdB family regulatory protein